MLPQAHLITALVTPFTAADTIDYETLKKLTEKLMADGSDGFVIGGTTGEGPTLTETEKIELFTRFAKIVAGRALVIANTGTNSTAASVSFSKRVSQIPGIDALLVVVPYYNKPDQAGMIAHYTAVAAASALPLIIYNIPGRTGVTMQPATVAQLATNPNIAGIKQCGSDADFAAIVASTPADFRVWTGEDAQFVTSVTLGGAGVVSVATHLYAKKMAATYAALRRGDLTTVAQAQQELLPKMAALFAWPSPAPTKAALNASGWQVGSPRLPLQALNAAQQEALAAKLGVRTLSALKEV